MSKHPQRAKYAAPNSENLDSFFVTDFDLYKAIMSFPNGSAAGPDKKIPQIVSKSNGSAEINFLKSLVKLINLSEDRKKPEPLRPLFFGAKLNALTKIDGGLRPIAISNTLRRIGCKCAGSKALFERKFFFGNVQVGCGTKRGAQVFMTIRQCLLWSFQMFFLSPFEFVHVNSNDHQWHKRFGFKRNTSMRDMCH